MLNIDDYTDYPLYKGIKELNRLMEENNITPLELNVVGGFALMVHGLRDNNRIGIGQVLKY